MPNFAPSISPLVTLQYLEIFPSFFDDYSTITDRLTLQLKGRRFVNFSLNLIIVSGHFRKNGYCIVCIKMKGDAANESQYNHLPESAARQE